MKKHLEQKAKVGKRKPRLQDIDPELLPAAWSILRWCVASASRRLIFYNAIRRCVASCTAHIEAITSPEETINNLGEPPWVFSRSWILASSRPRLEAVSNDCRSAGGRG